MLSINKQQAVLCFIRIIAAAAILFVMLACGGQSEKKDNTASKQEINESLFDANKRAVQTEDQQIRDFLQRRNWDTEETGTGLFYTIYEKGNGEKAEENKIAVIEYTLSFLNGIQVYSSEELGPKEFLIGKGGVEPGLEEGILLMREGDRAKFVLPSHLGHGLVGDQDKIPAKTTLVYDVRLLELK